MPDFKDLAVAHSASSFLNALFREFTGCVITDKEIVVPFTLTEAIVIPLKKKSLLGRHQYTNEFFLRHVDQLSPISFLDVVERLTGMLALDYNHSREKAEIFIERVKNSLRNIEMSLEFRERDIQKLYCQPVSFRAAEQGLMIGHNFHPYPKMREGFDDADFKVYSPEMGGQFALTWFFVKPEVLHNQTAAEYKNKEWLQQLYKNEYLQAPLVPNGYIPFPVHTWQRQHLLKNPSIRTYLEQGLIAEAGLSQKPWYPTSSLRSVYGPHSDYMLKFSLTLRLTNSIRHLTDVEVVRGLQVYDVMATKKASEFRREFPQFHIIFEPAFAALKDTGGALISESIVVCRENPFKEVNESAKEENIVLSTLAQDNPLGGENLIQLHIKARAAKAKSSLNEASVAWFKKYLEVAVRPLVVGQAKYGILLGAHQQNLILTIVDHEPAKSFFRDCQGTGYSHQGYELYHKDVASLVKENGNILDEKGNILFGYYLIVNSTFNVISAIAQKTATDNTSDEANPEWVTEEQLIEILKAFFMELKEKEYFDTSFLDYVLKKPMFYQKGNFNCSLQNLNENTVANPLAIYNLISNPLYVSSLDERSIFDDN